MRKSAVPPQHLQRLLVLLSNDMLSPLALLLRLQNSSLPKFLKSGLELRL
jgi:hypothetical protein